ncbi:TetR family transcriptional regulator [Nocardia sp. NBC_01503]|uniref:TetR/AcrR family transcriptional regulator n=1 Tax=Nocardia sp. NBC_01503 TaxID=2975997 RepID=UPI002E7B6721|nr:TetR family transcriptional regulator [Nocardia sp. NBC_01503]WTL31583.1 TetR family transcriptional regulator [Nocardia sp. NBC_01503]
MSDGLRARKKRETRLALSMAAIQLAVERGWDNVTVDDIAAAANVSVRTFRNYFSSKAEAVASRHLERMEQVAEEFAARPDGETLWEAMTAAVLDRFALGETVTAETTADRHWVDGIRIMLGAPAVQVAILEANATAQQTLTAAVAARTGTDASRDLYPNLVAAAVSAAISAAIDHSQRADPAQPLMGLLREALDRLATGLPVP